MEVALVLKIPDELKEYYDEVKKFAATVGRGDQLKGKLNYLAQFGCKQDGTDPERCICTLHKDFAPHSFGWSTQIRKEDGTYDHWLAGGLIFHGPHDNGGDGGAPTFSVSLTPTDGWEIHS